jgi:hypothetical protein
MPSDFWLSWDGNTRFFVQTIDVTRVVQAGIYLSDYPGILDC